MLPSRIAVPGRARGPQRSTSAHTHLACADSTETNTIAPARVRTSLNRFEKRMAQLEGGRHAIAFDSRTAARAAVRDSNRDSAHSDAAGNTTGDVQLIDNTATPVLRRPLEHGADAVIHASLDQLNGHGDAQGAVIVTSDDELAGRLRRHRDRSHSALAPAAAWLTSLGLDTLSVRMRRHTSNARAVAAMLAQDRRIGRVHHSGLGGIVTVSFRTAEAAQGFAAATRLFATSPAVGLIASQVAVVTKCPDYVQETANLQSNSYARGLRRGDGPALVRLSVGIEDAQDLQADLAGALDRTQHRIALRG